MDRLFDVRFEARGTPRAERGEIIWLQRPSASPGFTARDRIELAKWGQGERRAVVWDAEPATFAMLYKQPMPWASWAVSRQEGTLVAWDCVSLADIGRFDSMVDALAALPGEYQGLSDVLPNVVSFATARLARVGAGLRSSQ